MAQPLVSFITPVFNEEGIVRNSIEALIRQLDELSFSFEVIVANDGSSDRTMEEAQKLSLRDYRVRALSTIKNMGRGEAIQVAAKQAKGRIIAFTDIDMATDLDHLPELIYPIIDGSCEISSGSRWLPGADVKRGFTRKVISLCYNKLIRLLFRSIVFDHQCGFKAFTRTTFMILSQEMKIRNSRSWAWDTEILIRAQIHGFRIKEFPVRWKEGRKSKFKILVDPIKVLTYVIRLRLEIIKNRVPTPTVIEHFDSIPLVAAYVNQRQIRDNH